MFFPGFSGFFKSRNRFLYKKTDLLIKNKILQNFIKNQVFDLGKLILDSQNDVE